MPADLDQFRREDSHGTIVGGKGLVQFTHDTADGGGLLHEFDQKTGIGKIQGSLHARNTGPHHHDRTISCILIHEMSISYSLMFGVICFWMWFSLASEEGLFLDLSWDFHCSGKAVAAQGL